MVTGKVEGAGTMIGSFATMMVVDNAGDQTTEARGE